MGNSCGKSQVDVEITIDNYGEETTYEIKDSSNDDETVLMNGSGWPSNSVNSFWKCFSNGTYSFTITDGLGDGLCCSYGDGGYSVTVNGSEVISGGPFGSEETKSFQVGSTSSAPISPTHGPSVSAPDNGLPTLYPTHTPPTPYPTDVPPTRQPSVTPPTSFPTGVVPTQFPTGTPPTPYPTHTAPTFQSPEGSAEE